MFYIFPKFVAINRYRCALPSLECPICSIALIIPHGKKKQPTESVLSKILLIFASTLVKTGGKLRRATTLLTVSESANSTVKVLEELGAALSISYIYAPASRRGRHAYMPYRCGLFFILTFTGIAEPTGEE